MYLEATAEVYDVSTRGLQIRRGSLVKIMGLSLTVQRALRRVFIILAYSSVPR